MTEKRKANWLSIRTKHRQLALDLPRWREQPAQLVSLLIRDEFRKHLGRHEIMVGELEARNDSLESDEKSENGKQSKDGGNAVKSNVPH